MRKISAQPTHLFFVCFLWLLYATNMADNTNNITRKRKSSDIYNNFGVDDLECSPSNSPEPSANILKCSVVKEAEIKQTSTDTPVNKMEKEEICISVGAPSISQQKTDDLRCMDMEVDNSPAPAENHQDANTNKPFLSVIFHDNEFAIIFKSQIVNYIKNLVSFELIEECKRESGTIVNLWEYPKQTVVDDKESDELFSVDTTPSKGRDYVSLPKYSTNNSSIIEECDPNKPNGDAGANKASMLVCFNCDGNHAIRDCKEVRDHRRISIARNKYLANAPAKTTRYHLDDEQKYKHLVPGKISEKLKKALNVRKHEVPSYIYRMRMFGYPPGWLEEARVTNSSLELFDFQGCSVEESTNNKKIIDASKIVEYPGFNVPLEKGDIDDYKYYRCPAYCEQFSKKTMLEYIESYADSQKVNTTAIKETKCESDSNSQESENAEQLNKRSASPTLNDLELRKRQLLAELEDGCTSSPQPTIPENSEITKEPEIKNEENPDAEIKPDVAMTETTVEITETNVEITETNVEIAETDVEMTNAEVAITKTDVEIAETDVTITETENTITETKESEAETPVKSDVIESPSVVSSTFGTPILKTASPFSQLPDRDKWSKDISQVINFENLPNATGKYEQMTKVISKVRSIVKGTAEDDNKS